MPEARDELDRYDGKAISIISWMEVMVGAAPGVEVATRAFLDGFEIIALDDGIAERAVALRKAHRVKLPNAIIWALARAGAWIRRVRMVARALGERASIPAGTIGEIRNTLKSGSASAYVKIARALDLPIEAVLPEIVG